MNDSAKFKVNHTETVTVRRVVRTSIFKSNKGNTVILDGIFTKCVSCTSTAPNEHFCQVSSELDWNCRRSCPDKIMRKDRPPDNLIPVYLPQTSYAGV